MGDALISPAVGGAMWVATAGLAVYSAKKVREEGDAAKVPLMGVVGAFIFASQMLNFTIPATGSSGHLGGGLILAILLGPHAAFLVMASVLTVQALFFADGGLLALGANIFNMAFFSAFIAYPFVYKKIVGDSTSTGRLVTGSVIAAVAGLSLGAVAVVLETTLSGITELPFATFLALMLPIHVAIGLVEGLVTAAVVVFVQRTQPEILTRAASGQRMGGVAMRNVLVGLAVAAVLAGAVFAWFASANPDGLEWSVAGVTGSSELEAGVATVYGTAASLQEQTAILPDYAFKETEGPAAEEGDAAWPAVDAGTSVAGIVGALLTLLIAVGVGILLSRKSGRETPPVNT
jgi:cobalt/nickel transport system permease protein